MRRATLADVDLIKRILRESFKNDPHVNWLLEESKNKFKLNILIDYVVHQTLRKGDIHLSDDNNAVALWDSERNEKMSFIKPYEPPPSTDKLMRLHAQTAVFENGDVFLPQSAPWLDEYVQELTAFPGSKHDDQVDSTTQALDYLRINRSLLVWQRLGQAPA